MQSIVIIPTYNEKENISPLLEGIFSAEPSIYVQIVDDSSPDGTAEQVRKLQKKYSRLELFLREKKEGLGMAYLAAFRKVLDQKKNIDVIIMMDADLTHDPKDLPKLLEEIKNYDFVIGSSLMNRAGRLNYPWYRNIFSRLANLYCSIILGKRLSDWTNAYMAIKKNALEAIDLENIEAKEYAFVFGLKYALIKNGSRGKEIPSPALKRQYGYSKVRFSTIFEAILAPWKLRRTF